jgi:DNA ligase (NAD+)
VITGAIADPRSGERLPRPAFQRLCEHACATTASSVSANTDLLVCAANVGTSKTTKAEKARHRDPRPGRALVPADRAGAA